MEKGVSEFRKPWRRQQETIPKKAYFTDKKKGDLWKIMVP